MELFTVDNGIVIPNTYTLLIHPFSDIWERDVSERKEIASAEYSYIEFLCSFAKTNVYAGLPEETKEIKVRENILRKFPDWTPDDMITEGILVYCMFRDEGSPTLRFYLAALEGADKVQTYYKTVDLNERAKNGMLVHKASDIVRTLSQSSQVMNNLELLRVKVQQELFESNKIRANRIVNHFEK